MDMVDEFDLYFVVSVVFFLLGIKNVVHILRQNLSPGASLAWMAINMTLPILGVPLYYFLGQSKIGGYKRKRDRRQEALKHKKEEGQPKELSSELDQLGRFQEMAKALCQLDHEIPLMRAEVELMINGENAFPAIFSEIKMAKEYVVVQYYILRSDRLGLELQELLKEKAQRGLSVYLLIDDWGSFGLGRAYVRDLKKAGVKVARFLPFRFRFGFQINFRNHRKLVVVDGRVAFTGGLNVGLEYLGRKGYGFWRDTHLKLHGDGVICGYMNAFFEDWFFATSEDLRDKLPIPPSLGTESCRLQMVHSVPGVDLSGGMSLFFQAISSSRKSLFIATPYLIPDSILEMALIQAALRGVEISILIPKKGDNPFIHMVSLAHAEKLRKYMRIYLYTKGFMHQKVLLIDEEVAVMGTCNFDNRSMYLNFETSLAIYDREFAKRTHEMLCLDQMDSILLSNTTGLKRWQRRSARFLRLLAPLF